MTCSAEGLRVCPEWVIPTCTRLTTILGVAGVMAHTYLGAWQIRKMRTTEVRISAMFRSCLFLSFLWLRTPNGSVLALRRATLHTL